MAIREDEIAAKAMGINTRNVKLLAFAMGASFGGVSGAMFASFQGFVSPESFVLIGIDRDRRDGGAGRHGPHSRRDPRRDPAVRDPECCASSAKPAQEALFGTEIVAPEALRMLLFGLAMVLIMLRRPEGLWPLRGTAKPERTEGRQDGDA
jgi:branched-chain amino acid transport system permease protein